MRSSCAALLAAVIGHVVERNAVALRDRSEVFVVADDQRDLALELACAAAQQEVVHAVVVLADHHRQSLPAVRVGEPEAHREALGDLGEAALQGHAVGAQLGQVDADALEELPRDEVRVLIGVEDIDAMPVEQLGEAGHQPFAVGARHEQGRVRRWR